LPGYGSGFNAYRYRLELWIHDTVKRRISSYLTAAKEVTPGTLAAVQPLPVLLAGFSAVLFSVCCDSFTCLTPLFSFVAVEEPFGLFPCLAVVLADFLTTAFGEEDFAFSGEQRRGVEALTEGDRRVGVTPFLRAGRAGGGPWLLSEAW
jgi:hypothetical protein